ncbi:MAG TPA: MraY family glycosyltransferase, partial [Aggregatilineaceae bacterium]|nr:MraY family glycosyltransferase [Aggregatilineaceae bacterium]
MSDLFPLAVIGFAASLGLTPLTRQLARRFGIVDKPSARKVHQVPTPLMGGLAIYGAFMIALLLFHTWTPDNRDTQALRQLIAILGGATWLVIVGFVDDRRMLSPQMKFAGELIATAAVILSGIRVQLFNSPWLDIPLTVFWMVGIINAINFLDNMDGLAAGISAIAALCFFVLAAIEGQVLVATLAAAMFGSSLGFLFYNFSPATTFMGDMGALVLGFLLAVLGIKLSFPNQSPLVSWTIPILALGLPIFDTTLVVFTRLREKRSPMQGGKDHTSHRLVIMGLSYRAAVVTLYMACILLGLAALIVSQASVSIAAIVGGGVALVGLGAFIILESVRIRQYRNERVQKQ